MSQDGSDEGEIQQGVRVHRPVEIIAEVAGDETFLAVSIEVVVAELGLDLDVGALSDVVAGCEAGVA